MELFLASTNPMQIEIFPNAVMAAMGSPSMIVAILLLDVWKGTPMKTFQPDYQMVHMPQVTQAHRICLNPIGRLGLLANLHVQTANQPLMQ